MFSKTMRAGEAVEIGDAVVIRVENKSGSATKLSFFTDLPIRELAWGIIPARYAPGIAAPQRRILESTWAA